MGMATHDTDVAVSSASIARIVTPLEILDDWDETDRAKVNPIVGQAGVAAGAGAVGVTVPRVTLASDDPAVAALQVMDDWDETNRAAVNLVAGQAGVVAGTGVDAANALRVSLATNVALPAGTNAIGKLAANSGVDIGDVDVLSVPAPLSITGGGAEATALRVTIANDSTGVVSVDDNGAGLTVDSASHDSMPVNATLQIADVDAPGGAGAVSASTPRMTLGSDDPAVAALQVIDDWDETNRAAVNLIAGQAAITGGAGAVAANTPRTTLASDDPAVAGIGGTADAASAVGGVGSASAKLRLLTTLIDAAKSALEAIDNAVSGNALRVGGYTAHIAKDVAIQSAAYAAEDCLGGKFVFSNVTRNSGLGCVVKSVQFTDESGNGPEVHLFLADRAFGSAPADNASMSAGAAAAFGATDRDVIQGPFSIATSDWEDVDGNTKVARLGIAHAMPAPNAARDYGAILKVGGVLGAAAATRNMRVTLEVLQD